MIFTSNIQVPVRPEEPERLHPLRPPVLGADDRVVRPSFYPVWHPEAEHRRAHLQTLRIYKLGFNQNYYTFTLILLIKIVLCSIFP